MATITKRELAIRITDKIVLKHPDISQQNITTILQLFIDEIADSLAGGNRVVMRRFGTFEVREMKAKLGRNPKDPTATVKIPARAGVKFKPGNELKDKVAATLTAVRERKVTKVPKSAIATKTPKAVKTAKAPTAAKTAKAGKSLD